MLSLLSDLYQPCAPPRYYRCYKQVSTIFGDIIYTTLITGIVSLSFLNRNYNKSYHICKKSVFQIFLIVEFFYNFYYILGEFFTSEPFYRNMWRMILHSKSKILCIYLQVSVLTQETLKHLKEYFSNTTRDGKYSKDKYSNLVIDTWTCRAYRVSCNILCKSSYVKAKWRSSFLQL